MSTVRVQLLCPCVHYYLQGGPKPKPLPYYLKLYNSYKSLPMRLDFLVEL